MGHGTFVSTSEFVDEPERQRTSRTYHPTYTCGMTTELLHIHTTSIDLYPDMFVPITEPLRVTKIICSRHSTQRNAHFLLPWLLLAFAMWPHKPIVRTVARTGHRVAATRNGARSDEDRWRPPDRTSPTTRSLSLNLTGAADATLLLTFIYTRMRSEGRIPRRVNTFVQGSLIEALLLVSMQL